MNRVPLELEAHFARLRRWISMESEAERLRMNERIRSRDHRNAESRGDTLLDLAIQDHRMGLGGRYLVTFGKRNRTQSLPWNRFRVGTPVVASDEVSQDEAGYGIVCSRTQDRVEVAFDEWPEADRFRLDLSPDEITRNRQLSALKNVQVAKGRTSQLRDVLLGLREPKFDLVKPIEIEPRFNESQKQAIQFALSAEDVAIIHGPPGTGKTTTVVELIRQSVLQGKKVLACAPSNTGVDNLLEKLIASHVRVVRIGHPARVQEDLQPYTLDALVQADAGTKVIAEMLRDAERLRQKAGKFTRAKPAPGAKQELWQESKRLRDDARLFEKQIIQYTLDRADVICATTNFDPEVLGDRNFDLAVIDEAGQSTEPGCWTVIPRADKIVLAGDHCQLPPTILSKEADAEGFGISMMERLAKSHASQLTRRLNVQYRMHEHIMRYSSDSFYEGSLEAHESVKGRLLTDLISEPYPELTLHPVTFVDTAGASYDEETDPDGESRQNASEGRWILTQVQKLCASGILPEKMAVIAPYAAQVRWLRQNCQYKQLEIDTVDGFQGREKEAILISLVRSNPECEIGFLADTRRMNVALTRAKRKLILIGDSATLASHPFYAEMIAYMESIAGYSSIWEQADYT
jgi:ATP-dependent RNA/DNA helicase IGHMBP2